MKGVLLSFLAAMVFPSVHAQRETVVFFVQGMTCADCIVEVRTAVSKIPTASQIHVTLKPQRAKFTFDPTKVSLQDVVVAIRKAGRQFDAKVLLKHDAKLSESKLEELDKALEAVSGVKNTGAPDELGLREITLQLDKKTTLAELIAAGRSVGVSITLP